MDVGAKHGGVLKNTDGGSWYLKCFHLRFVNSLPLKKFQKNFEDYYEEYIKYGGFPGVVLEPDVQRKELLLRDI